MTKVQSETICPGVRRIWLNQPDRRNAVDEEMLSLLQAALTAAEADLTTKAVIIRGRGGHFCAGRAMDADGAGAGAQDGRIAISGQIALQMRATRLVTIGMIEGYAVGIGMSLALWCDLTIAAETAVFVAPELERGIPPTMTAATLLRFVPEKRAMWMLLTGAKVRAVDAQAWGALSAVVTESALPAEEAAMAARFRDASPTALRMFKSFVGETTDMDWATTIGTAHRTSMDAVVTEDAREGVKAFREKRKPVWSSLTRST